MKREKSVGDDILVWKRFIVSDTSDDDIDRIIDIICLFISTRKYLELFNLSSSIVFQLEFMDTSLDTLFNILYCQVRIFLFFNQGKSFFCLFVKNVGDDHQRIVDCDSIE